MSQVFVFPGQGSQYVGMGHELYQKYPEAREIFQQANEVLNFDLASLCFEGPEDKLNQTINTQPALLTVSAAAMSVLNSRGIKGKIAAGHSLGEYSALVYAGVIEFSDAVLLVQLRGKYMQEAAPKGLGGMAAILGLNGDLVKDICLRACAGGDTVEAVNFNCPGQVVIAGTESGLHRAMELAKEAGARRCIPLNVSGPFHSSFMRPAAEKLAETMEKIVFSKPNIPVVSNVTADYVSTALEAKQKLIEQVYSAVRWEESIHRMYKDGHNSFIEVGPGKVLGGLIKKTVKDINVYNVEDSVSLEKVLAHLEEVG